MSVTRVQRYVDGDVQILHEYEVVGFPGAFLSLVARWSRVSNHWLLQWIEPERPDDYRIVYDDPRESWYVCHDEVSWPLDNDWQARVEREGMDALSAIDAAIEAATEAAYRDAWKDL